MSNAETRLGAQAATEVDPTEPRSRSMRVLVVLLAILVPQLFLFGASVVGAKILLPLDVLTVNSVWIAPGEPGHRDEAQDWYLSDLTFVIETNRRYAAEAVRSGRLPLWSPHNYCGAPFLASNQPAVFSPFRLVDYAWPGPEAIAFGQLLKSVVAGLGAYVFLRRALGSTFAGATLAASAFSLSGYMILWAGCPLSNVAAWLPWMLLATHATVAKPRSFAPIGLALAGAAALVSGHAANAGHLFLASGVYALWRIHVVCGTSLASIATALPALCAVVFGWLAGFALSAPQLVPTLEYMGQSARIATREQGIVETPTEGLVALLQVVLPYSLGSGEKGAVSYVDISRFEGGPSACAGLIALLVLAPLAFASEKRRAQATFFAILGAVALIPLVGVPYVDSIFKLPPLVYLRNNRLTLIAVFSIIVLAAFGIDALVRGHVRPKRWHFVPIALCALLAIASLWRVVDPPDLFEELHATAWFRRYDALAVAVSCTGVAMWFTLRNARVPVNRLAWILAGCVALELTLDGAGVNPQCDRELYFPRLKVLGEIEKREPGRMIGVDCIEPNLVQLHGLCDVRGYDAADPVRIVEVLRAGRDERSAPELPYAATMNHLPKNPSGISDMLALRWIVLPGSPPNGEEVAFTGGGYSLMENTRALPRAYVPKRVEVVADKARRLALLGASEFDPREVAYIERAPEIQLAKPASGSAKIVVDEPEHVVLDVSMQAAGLVVLADSFDAGWNAKVDGVAAPIQIANHALRGVCVPAGAHRIEYRYEPRSFTIGLWIAAAAVVFMCAWTFFVPRRRTLA